MSNAQSPGQSPDLLNLVDSYGAFLMSLDRYVEGVRAGTCNAAQALSVIRHVSLMFEALQHDTDTCVPTAPFGQFAGPAADACRRAINEIEALTQSKDPIFETADSSGPRCP